MFSTVDREIGGIVLGVLGWHPIKVCGVAAGAIIAEVGLHVVGLHSTLIIRLVAGKTVGGRT